MPSSSAPPSSVALSTASGPRPPVFLRPHSRQATFSAARVKAADAVRREPLTCYFVDRTLERAFRNKLWKDGGALAPVLVLALLFVFAAGVLADLSAHRDDTEALRIKAMAAVALAVLLSALACASCGRSGGVSSASAALTGLCGAVWGFYTAAEVDKLGYGTSSAGLISFLAVLSASSSMLYPHQVAVMLSSLLCYAASAAYYRPEGELHEVLVLQLVYAAVACAVLCYGAHRHEVHRRRSFLLGRSVASDLEHFRERADELSNANRELREEVMHGITSPVEDAVGLVAALARSDSVDPADADTLGEVVRLLSHAGNLFQPKLDRVAAGMDRSTQDWYVYTLFEDAAASSQRRGTASGGGRGSRARDGSLSPPAGSRRSRHDSLKPGALASVAPSLDRWNFDAFAASDSTGGRPLLYTAFGAIEAHGLFDELALGAAELAGFLTAVERAYRADVPYHNALHAADVTQATHFFMVRGGLAESMSAVEKLALLVAAAVHDVAHPGRNNAFLVATGNELARVYNDRTVLENHHVARAFELLARPENDFLAAVRAEDPAAYAEFRALVVEHVLSTDLSLHLDRLTRFQHACKSEEVRLGTPDGRAMAATMALKCADLSHACKELALHRRWSDLIIEEFFQQGDDERERGLPVSPFMDRHDTNVPQSQHSFIAFLVQPTVDVFVRFLGKDEEEVPAARHVAENQAYWLERVREKGG